MAAGKRGGKAGKGKVKSVKSKEQKEVVKRPAPPPRETRRESYGYDEEESYEDSDDVRHAIYKEKERGRPSGRRQVRDEDEEDSYYMEDSFESFEDVSERGASIGADIEAERGAERGAEIGAERGTERGSPAGRERPGRRRRPKETRDRDLEHEEPYEKLTEVSILIVIIIIP